MSSSASPRDRKKFLLHRLNDSDDETSDIEWELPTRRRFISLTQNDLLQESFTSNDIRKSNIKIDEKGNDEMISSQINEDNEEEEISEHNRYSMRKSQTNNMINKTIQKIFEEQNKMREEIQKQFKQFNEYKEIENMEKEMEEKQEIKLKKEKELKQKELQKEEERKKCLKELEDEKEMELTKIKEIINKEFSKRNNELLQKQQEIENLKKELEEKINDQNELNNALKDKSTKNGELINNLKNKMSELQDDQKNLIKQDEIEENKKEISNTEYEIENVEMKQEEILKEINDNIEIQETLENEAKELDENEKELLEEKEHLEIEEKEEIKKRSKNAYKKFDIRRANIMMESHIEFEYIRERKSLLNREDMIENIKLKMRKQFKEQMMRLRLQIQNKTTKHILPYIKLNNINFGEGDIIFACSPNNEFVACVGINGILHIDDIKNGDGVYLQSLKEIIVNYDENIILKDDIKSVDVVDIKWDKESNLLGILIDNCQWIGIWNSITMQFYEFTVDGNDIITSFAWSRNKLLLGMNNGDIHIKDMYDEKGGEGESKLITIKNKMLDKIDICRWSINDKYGIVVNDTHIAIINDIGLTAERILSKQIVNNLKCGTINDKNVLTVISSNNLIFHGIDDKTKRKLMRFDNNFGSIINHCWCHESIIIAFQNGNVIILNASTYNNKHIKCAKLIKDMDATYLVDIGYIVAIIENKYIRFLKFVDDMQMDRKWELIALIDYTDSEWIIKHEIPIKIQLTQNAKHSVVVTDKGTMIIYKLMM